MRLNACHGTNRTGRLEARLEWPGFGVVDGEDGVIDICSVGSGLVDSEESNLSRLG